MSLAKPDWLCGNEKRFAEFISGLANAKKIISLSHTDLDGIASAKAVDYALNVDKTYLVDYIDLNDNLIDMLKKDEPTHIVITDLFIKNTDFIRRLENFSIILIIDHHQITEDFNSSKIFFMNSQGMCASYLAYYLFSEIRSLEKIDWLIACASISDFTISKNQEWMIKVFEKYGEKFDPLNLRKGRFFDMIIALSNGLIYFHNDKLKILSLIKDEFFIPSELEKPSRLVQDEINEKIAKFEEEKIPIKEGFFWDFSARYPIKSIISTIASMKYKDKTIIITKQEGNYLLISARRQDKKENMNTLLKELVKGLENSQGGGHIAAAGGYILFKDREELMKRLKDL